MRILLVSFYYAPELGGAPTRLTHLAEGLARAGAEVDVLTTLPNYPKGRIFEGYRGRLSCRERIGDVGVYRMWTYATVARGALKRGISMVSFAAMIWAFAWRLRRIRSYDCVVIQSPPLPVAVSALTLFGRIFGRRCVVNVSDLWPLSAVELGAMRQGSRIHRLFGWMERYVYRHADGFMGQSVEILDHIGKYRPDAGRFLYRNLKPVVPASAPRRRSTPMRVVYAGLFGVPQDILGLLRNIDFKGEGIELHLYGGGNQAEAIQEWISSHPGSGVTYHGYVDKEQLARELEGYDASLVPLATAIHGAVPSKIFDLLPAGLPSLFCGGGEGAEITRREGVGLVSDPGDYEGLKENLRRLRDMPPEEYEAMSRRALGCAADGYNFGRQMEGAYRFITNR